MKGQPLAILAAALLLPALAFGATAINHHYPEASTQEIKRRAAERDAVTAVIWAMPAVNSDLMYQAAIANKAGPNQIAYWSRLPDWKNQTLTPNPNAVYLMPFIDTRNGPVVLEIPAASDEGSIIGNIDDAWQVALEDVGPPGLDKGQGGKFLILPPGYKDRTPEGYIPLPSDTFNNFALLRSIPKGGSEADVARAAAYGKRVRLYPLAEATKPAETAFVDMSDVVFDATIPYDVRFFQSLDRVVQQEPWLTRDRVMIDVLKSLGIEKGKPFAADADRQALLKEAALEAKAWMDQRFESQFSPSFYEGTHWALPVSPDVVHGQSDGYARQDDYPIFARGVTYAMAFVGVKRLGTAQYFLMSIKDHAGRDLEGARNYRLTIPAHVPVSQFWSVAVYDRKTHGLIRNLPVSSHSSQESALQKNPDGSVNIYFGPKALAGKEPNWIPTDASGRFEVLMRFYGPDKALFEKTWKLSDMQVM